MIIRSRAPLRVGLAGGGTDVDPYRSVHGGVVLNTTINLYARCTLEVAEKDIVFTASDIKITRCYKLGLIELEGELLLHKAVYNYSISRMNGGKLVPVKLSTYCDAPPGSGLGSSSTIVVAMLKAFQKLFNYQATEYEIAQIAYHIEREIVGLKGGMQDQYAATFGGINFIEFRKNGKTIVNPLRVRKNILSELEESSVLFFTGRSRSSEEIISDQIKSISNDKRLMGMHKIKSSARMMKDALLEGDLENFIEQQKIAWIAKKSTSKSISNERINKITNALDEAGSLAYKISGAGGGGFMMIYFHPQTRKQVVSALEEFEGRIHNFNITDEGASAWRIT